ncbi:MAG: fluoride efflux transporter FluC, partial [Halothiobacillaceae bacterium]
ARFGLTGLLMHWLGRGFPFGTLAVNVIGSALMGFLAVWLTTRWAWPIEYRIAVLTGFLGAFTTFSAFSIDALALMGRNQWFLAALYVVGTVLLCLAGARAGMLLAERLA